MEIEIVNQLPKSLRVPTLYDKTGTTKLGELINCTECFVEEERNGLFEVSFIYPTTDTLFNSLEKENIVICDANDTLLNQKFRIYMTRKVMGNKVEVYARHISFDLAYDYVKNINIANQSCEYVLNTIFRQSQFSTHYKGYSDIVNAQDYSISNVNCIQAIAGTEGSIIDTFGTGAEILRDNINISVLNKRGNDNGVTIEYAKNLTGFELEEDTTDLVTRIIPYATYNNDSSEETLVEATAVDSPLINNYSHPYISRIDYSEKFEEGVIPTTSKLIELAKAEYKNNKVDMPKQNFTIEFVPLSKCVGYEGLEDKISLCDTVTIIDTRYGINTKAKVIRTVFNVLKNRYESIELGEPRTTLGDIINSGEDGAQGPAGPVGPQGPAGSNGDDGRSIQDITVEYYLSDSKDSLIGGSWGTTQPIWEYGKYLWTRTKIDWINPVGTTYTNAVVDATWDAIDNIQIGARNYLLGTGKSVSITGSNSENQCIDLYYISDTNSLVNKLTKLKFKCTVTNYEGGTFDIQTHPNMWWAYVYHYKPVGNGTFEVEGELSFGDEVTFDRLQLRLDNFIGKIEIREMILSTGSHITDWVPAIEDFEKSFPNELPAVPVLSSKVYGFANIELSWTFENKVYYQYELYASKTKDFIPNTFDLIHQGQSSSFLFQAKPSETWYFRVCAINSYGNRTGFSEQVEIATKKVDDMSNYFESAAIGNAVVGALTADYMEAGIIKGNWIDAKQLSVTDGNDKRTFDIDSFGNIVINPTTMEVNSATGIKILHSNGAYTLLNNKDLRQVNSDGKVTLAMNGWQYKCYDFGNNNNFIGGMTPTGSDSGYWKTSLFSNNDAYPVSIGYVGSDGALYDYIHCTRATNSQNRAGITFRQNVHMHHNGVRVYWNEASKDKHQVSMYAGSNVAADNSITVWGLWNHTLDKLLMRFFTDGSLQIGKHLKMYRGNSIWGRNPNDEEMMMIENPTSGSLYIGPPKTQVSNSSNTGGIGQITNLRGGETRIYAHWSAVYLGSSGSTVVTSDRNLKHDIECLDNRYEEMFKCLKPVTYIYNEHKRKHVGFIAQEVEEAMINAGITSEEFAGLCINKDFTDDPNGDGGTFYEKLYTLRYEEFIALNTQMIQKNMKEISDLKDENAKLKSRIDKIEKMLGITE